MLHNSALIIRFSSFGDIVQATFAADSLKEDGYSVDLITKKEFSNTFKAMGFPYNRVISYDKKNGPSLWSLSGDINKSKHRIIFDAHNNQRTLLLKTFLVLRNPLNFFKFRTRSKFRLKRFFLFNLRLNFFPKPFKGAESFLKPLKLSLKERNAVEPMPLKKSILLAPSAAWDLKKWHEEKWVELGNKLIQHGFDVSFIGGPDDKFIEELSKNVPFSHDLSGKLSWNETTQKIKDSNLLISGDTGVLHIADFFGVKAIGLMGPSAFGRTSRDSSHVISKDLKCQPCSKDGRGKCNNTYRKKCLALITPQEIYEKAQIVIGGL